MTRSPSSPGGRQAVGPDDLDAAHVEEDVQPVLSVALPGHPAELQAPVLVMHGGA